MSSSRILRGLSVLMLACASLCASCKSGSRFEGPLRPVIKIGGTDPATSPGITYPRKGTPTPIVINEVVPATGDTSSARWNRAVNWTITDDLKDHPGKPYSIDFSFYQIDMGGHTISALKKMFVAEVQSSSDGGSDANKHSPDQSFLVIIKASKEVGAATPERGVTYLLVGTVTDDVGGAEAYKGAGSYLFQYQQ